MPDLLEATGQPDRAQVLLHVVLADPAVSVTIERTTDGATTWSVVRGADDVTLIGGDDGGGEAYTYDAEMPLDVPVTYRATPRDASGGTLPAPATVVVQVDSDGYAWIKDPSRPWASVRTDWETDVRRCMADTETAVTLTALGTETYAADATLTAVNNRATPSDVFAVRKAPTTSAQWLSRTLAAYQSMRVLMAWGGPLFLQMPPVYGWPDQYYQPGDVQPSRISRDMRRPQRFWDAPLAVVDPPVGPAQGVAGGTWCDLGAEFATYADMSASGLTWGQIIAVAEPDTAAS